MVLVPMLVACGGGGGGAGSDPSGDSSPPVTSSPPPGMSSPPPSPPPATGTSSPPGTSSSPVPNLSHIAWLVDPGTARNAISTAVALPLSSSQGLGEINAIAARSNEIDASRFWYKPQGGTLVHSPYDCEGGSCHNLRENDAPDYGLHDKNGLNLYHTAIELQPVMSHHGVSIGQVRATSRSTDTQLYGGWMEHSAFFVRSLRHTSDAHTAGFPHAFGYTHWLIDNTGNNYRANPQDLSSSGLGGTWTGAVVGIRYSSGKEGHVVHGTAEVSIPDFTNVMVNVSFTGLHDRDAGESVASMQWSNLSVTEGAFSSVDANPYNEIRGRFYGSEHTDATGTFDRNSIIGAFGAIRHETGTE